MDRFFLILVPFAALSLVLSACKGEETSGQETETPTTTQPEQPLVPEEPAPGDGRTEILIPPVESARQLQEYLLESVLGAVVVPEGLQTNGTSRFTRDPVFWFDDTGRGTLGERDARILLSAAVPILTNNLYSAKFREETQHPLDPCSVITVTFASPRGEAYYDGADCHDISAQYQRERVGSPITGGHFLLSSSLKTVGIPESNDPEIWTFRHELGHVFGLDHAFQGSHVMAYGSPGNRGSDYTDVEREAFSILYSYPSGTSLNTLMADGKIAPGSLSPPPHIDDVMRWNETTQFWETARGSTYEDFSARPGQYILLYGSRMTLAFMTERATTLRPAGYAPPEVYFESIRVVADVSETYQEQTSPLNSFQGNPARYLKVQVPLNAPSGRVFVRVRGLESNPVYLQVIR